MKEIIFDQSSRGSRNMAHSRSIFRFTEKRIRSWLMGISKDIHEPLLQYRVSFHREGAGHLIGCQIEIQYENLKWSGSELGSGLHQALISAMKCMVPSSTTTQERFVPRFA